MQTRGSRDPSRSVVFVTFESEFNRFGGLGAVMKELPKVMLGYEDCVVVAPFFPALTDLHARAPRTGPGGPARATDPHDLRGRKTRKGGSHSTLSRRKSLSNLCGGLSAGTARGFLSGW